MGPEVADHPGPAASGLVAGVRTIAVLRANAIGDYIMGLPALHALREAYPQAWLTLVGAPWHAKTLTGRPGPLDEVQVLPQVAGLAGLAPDVPAAAELPGFLDAMRQRRFDLAVQLHGGGHTSNPLVRQFGAGLTAGLRAGDAEPLDRWVAYRYYQPERARTMEAVELVGARAPGYPVRFAVTGDDVEQASAVVPEQDGAPLVALHPGATDERRRWPAERFAALGDTLAADGAQIIVTGSGTEADLVARVLVAMDAPARPVVGDVDIGGLAALYQRCAVVVSNDTGPRHLAEAVGTPTVGLFWCGNAINAAPADRARHRVLLSWTLHCPTCGTDCTRDLYPHRPGEGCEHSGTFLDEIPLAEAVEECVDLLGWQQRA